MKNSERLQQYYFDDYTIVTNFETYEDAVNYAQNHHGELTEVGFTDGADNPLSDDTANLIQQKKTFAIGLPPEYTVIYSHDERFQELAEKILVEMKNLESDIAPEDWIADQNIAPGDRIIILKNGTVNTVTTRERIKFLMRGNVYELAVKITN